MTLIPILERGLKPLNAFWHPLEAMALNQIRNLYGLPVYPACMSLHSGFFNGIIWQNF